LTNIRLHKIVGTEMGEFWHAASSTMLPVGEPGYAWMF
jgi:hypothetical protein